MELRETSYYESILICNVNINPAGTTKDTAIRFSPPTVCACVNRLEIEVETEVETGDTDLDLAGTQVSLWLV